LGQELDHLEQAKGGEGETEQIRTNIEKVPKTQ